jgi:Methyltransferase FkbM domain
LSSGAGSFQSAVASDAAQEVRIVTIDELVAHHGVPELAKIDVEGGGAAALAGAAGLLSRRSTSFLIEIHDETEAQAIRGLSGYRAEWADDAHVVVRPVRSPGVRFP